MFQLLSGFVVHPLLVEAAVTAGANCHVCAQLGLLSILKILLFRIIFFIQGLQIFAGPEVRVDLQICPIGLGAGPEVRVDLQICQIGLGAGPEVRVDLQICQIGLGAGPKVKANNPPIPFPIASWLVCIKAISLRVF